MASGKTPKDLYPLLWKALKEGTSFESEEFVNKTKDGSEFSVRAVFFPIKTGDHIQYFVQVLQDISHRKKIERRKDAFIGTASHEIRTPLTVMGFYLELLKQKLLDAPESTLELVNTIESESQKVSHLLVDLLDVSKMHADVQVLKTNHNLTALIHALVTSLQTTTKTHSIILESEPVSEVHVAYDEPRITEVLTNLITNAIKYSPAGDKVLIRIKTEGGAVVVSVQDFGIGVAPEERKKIFDMFYRAKNVTEGSGFGLGLFVSAQVISAHDGRLWVTSEVGKGSTFHFSLPL